MSLEPQIYTVSELTSVVKSTIESYLPPVEVEGEITGWTKAASGHVYFSLKDESSQISCILWRLQASSLLFKLEDGMKVRAAGRITVYERGGKYQLSVNRIHPLGVGDLFARFEKLKAKLAEEGFFDDARKIPIPDFPATVGIVTSRDGAVLWDIRRVLERRAPHVRLVFASASVQGDAAPGQISAAIDALNERTDIDVMIVGRGGGSIEDLWAFNTETVVKAISRSRIPVISAVGHQTDFTLADFTADLRAATPSVAAEMVAPERTDLLALIDAHVQSLEKNIISVLRDYERSLDEMSARYGIRRLYDLFAYAGERLREFESSFQRQKSNILKTHSVEVDSLAARLESLNPDAVLARGYSIVYTYPDKRIVRNSDEVAVDDVLDIKLAAGSFKAAVTEVN